MAWAVSRAAQTTMPPRQPPKVRACAVLAIAASAKPSAAAFCMPQPRGRPHSWPAGTVSNTLVELLSLLCNWGTGVDSGYVFTRVRQGLQQEVDLLDSLLGVALQTMQSRAEQAAQMAAPVARPQGPGRSSTGPEPASDALAAEPIWQTVYKTMALLMSPMFFPRLRQQVRSGSSGSGLLQQFAGCTQSLPLAPLPGIGANTHWVAHSLLIRLLGQLCCEAEQTFSELPAVQSRSNASVPAGSAASAGQAALAAQQRCRDGMAAVLPRAVEALGHITADAALPARERKQHVPMYLGGLTSLMYFASGGSNCGFGSLLTGCRAAEAAVQLAGLAVEDASNQKPADARAKQELMHLVEVLCDACFGCWEKAARQAHSELCQQEQPAAEGSLAPTLLPPGLLWGLHTAACRLVFADTLGGVMAERAAKALMLTFEAALHCMDQEREAAGLGSPPVAAR